MIKVKAFIKNLHRLINNSNFPSLLSIEFIEILSSRLLEYKKPLDFSDVPGVSRVCQRDFSHFLRALKLFELWALKSKSSISNINKAHEKCVEIT